MKTIHIFGWGRLYPGNEMDERLRAQRLRGAQNHVLCGTPPHWMWFWGAPQQNQCNGPRIPSDVTDSNHGFRPTYSLSPLPPYSPFLTVTQLRSFSPHGGGRFSIGSSQTSLSSPGYRWCIQCPMSGLYSPYQKIFFSRCLTNENIHYDVDENLWPNPQDRVYKHIEEQWGTLQTFYCRPKVAFSYLFNYFFEKPVALIISSIIFKFCLMIPVSVLFSLVYFNNVWMYTVEP